MRDNEREFVRWTPNTPVTTEEAGEKAESHKLPTCPVCGEKMVRAHVEMAELGTWGRFWLCGCFEGAER